MEQNTGRDCVISNNNKEEDRDNSSNNNNLPSELSMAELELLKKLEEANRYFFPTSKYFFFSDSKISVSG